MRIAIISDVHGNLEALRCVVAHLRRQSPDAIINLGDCVSAPLWPRETFDELQQLDAPTVRGNHDRWLIDHERIRSSPTVAFAVEQLDASAVDALANLPPTLSLFDSVLAVHGTPASDTEYLLEESVDRRLCLSTTQQVDARLGDTRAELIVCGHSHQQNTVFASGGRLVINPGAVGCPRYAGNADALDNEAGSPHARYAIATRRDGVWSAELFALQYDWHKPARRAASLGRNEWAAAFLKGA